MMFLIAVPFDSKLSLSVLNHIKNEVKMSSLNNGNGERAMSSELMRHVFLTVFYKFNKCDTIIGPGLEKLLVFALMTLTNTITI